MQTNETSISFVRHGHVRNPEDIYYGRLPRYPLSEVGEAQAHKAGAALAQAGLSAIYSSPLLRARQTAAIIQSHCRPRPPHRLTKLLLEVHTPFDGLSRTFLAAQNWDLYTGSAPPFEQPVDLVGRVQRFIKRMRAVHVGEHIAAVTHGDIIAFTLVWAFGHPPTLENKRSLREFGLPEDYPDTASISTLTFDSADLATLPRINYLNPHAS